MTSGTTLANAPIANIGVTGKLEVLLNRSNLNMAFKILVSAGVLYYTPC